MKNNKKGFTLIELLVVIAIIGLLATLSIIALNSAQAKARDVKRMSDVREIRTALEMYFASENAYPASTTPGAPIADSSGVVFMRSYPTPPKPIDGENCGTGISGSEEYVYKLDSNQSYSVYFCLGSNVNEVNAGQRTMTPAGIY
jgi:prepilin-type N-terminal cleavage/methylation domain-containing protein